MTAKRSTISRAVMTVEELALDLDLSVSTVSKKVQAREIPVTRIGNALRFTRTSIDRWLARNTILPDGRPSDAFARMQNRSRDLFQT